MRNDKSKISLSKKIKILNYLSFSLVIVITITISTFSHRYTNTINKVEETLESQWREEARDKAKYLSQQLELHIMQGNLNYWDDTQLHKWAEEQLLPMKVGGEMSNAILVNIGYSVRNWDDINWSSTTEVMGLELPLDAFNYISNHFSDLNLIGESNLTVKEYINSFASEFCELYDMEYDTIVEALQKVLFVKNKIIMDTTPGTILSNKFTNSRFIEDYLITDTDNFETNLLKILSGQESSRLERTYLVTSSGNKWLEWCVVPPNKLGWELEPPHREGVDNVGYKKIAIIIEVNENEIESDYSHVFSEAAMINLTGKIIVVTLSGISLIVLLVSFYRFLASEND